jgi:two-component system sensor histidine kinase/response regulator
VAQLASWGLRAEGAADAVTGREALSAAFLNNTPYAIALIDRFVGGLDGAEIGRSIKTAPDVKEIKLIMMTAFGRRGEGALFESIGFSAYLTKPLRSAQLRECLKMVAGESQQQKSPGYPSYDRRKTEIRHTHTDCRRHKNEPDCGGQSARKTRFQR